MDGRKRLIFDFDGTIIRLFTNTNLLEKKKELQSIFLEYGIEYSVEQDIFEVFALAAQAKFLHREELMERVNDAVIQAELQAIDSGIIVDGFFSYLEKLRERGEELDIVSNNSETCIYAFLKKFTPDISAHVIGRCWNQPSLMKPSPYLLDLMIQELGEQKENILYVGDNPRDYECANRCGVQFIGLTPTRSKRERLEANCANIPIYNNYFELLQALKGEG